MRPVWEPDADNVYLTSGSDNLALHRGDPGDPDLQSLDHLGFVAETAAGVEDAFAWAQEQELTIAKPLARHRDGSISFYLRDPDDNVIQVLYEPSISPLTFGPGKA
jgi:hypothetical protein